MKKKKILKKRSDLIEDPERNPVKKKKVLPGQPVKQVKKLKKKLDTIEELESQLKKLKKEITSIEEPDKKIKKKKRIHPVIEEPEIRLKKRKKKRIHPVMEEPGLFKKKKKKIPPEDSEERLKKKKKKIPPPVEEDKLKKKKKKISAKREGEDEVQYYQRLLVEDPSRIGIKLSLGKLFLKRKEYENAEKYLLEYVSRKDTSAEAFRCLGDAYYAQGQETPAANMYEKCAAIDPESIDLLEKVKRIRKKHRALDSYITQAKTNLLVGELEEAINMYQKALKLSPGDGSLLFSIGEIYEKMGNIPSAYEYYQGAIELSPANLKYQKKFHQIKVDRGEIGLSDMDEENFKHIIYLLKSSIAEKDDEHNNLCRLGELYLNQGMYSEAQQQFNQALMIVMSPRAFRGQGLVYRQLGDIKRAVKSMTNALKLDKDNFKNQQILVELYSQSGEKPDKAFQEIISLLGLPEDSTTAAFYRGILLEKHNWQKAIAYYQSVIEAEDDFVEAYYRTGALIIHHDLLEEAGMMLESALKLDGEHYRALTAMGRLALVKGELEKAEEYLLKALSLNSMYYEASLLLSKILMDQEEIEESCYLSEKADKTAPNTPEYHLERASIYIQQLDLNNAVKSYAKAITAGLQDEEVMKRIVSETIQVNDYTLLQVLSEALAKQDDIENLKVVYNQMVALKPEDNTCRINLARIYRKANDYTNAINLIKELCEKEPAGSILKLELAEAYYGLALLHISAKEYEEAKKALKNAIKSASWVEIDSEVFEKIKNFFTARKLDTIKKAIMDKKYTREALISILKKVTTNKKELDLIFTNAKPAVATENYHLLFGDIYAETGYFSNAIDLYFNALQINPKNPVIFYKSALVFEKLENYKEAADSYSEALALDDTNISYYDRVSELKLEMKEYQETAKITTKALNNFSMEPELKNKFEKRKYIAESKIWVMFKKDTSRRSFNISEKIYKLKNKALKQKWLFKIDGKITSSPVMSDGLVLIGSENTRLYALEKDSGEESWNFNTNGEIKSTPVVEPKQIYLASNGGYLYCIDKATLYQKWLFQTKSEMNSSPLIMDDIIYIGSDNGILYAIYIETGEVKWEVDARKAITTSPVIDKEAIYFGTREGSFQAVSLEGKELWTKGISSESLQSSPAIYENIICFGTPERKIIALESKTGEIIWDFETEGEVISSPAIAYNKFFVGSKDKNIYALDIATGNKIWKESTNGEVNSSPAIDNGILYAGNSEGYLYSIDVHSLNVEKKNLGSAISSSPAIADGMLFVATEEKGIYAFDLYGDE